MYAYQPLAAATLLALKQWPELLQRVSGAVLYYGVYDLAGTPSVRAAGPETLLLDGPGMVEALRMLTPGLSDDERQAYKAHMQTQMSAAKMWRKQVLGEDDRGQHADRRQPPRRQRRQA